MLSRIPFRLSDVLWFPLRVPDYSLKVTQLLTCSPIIKVRLARSLATLLDYKWSWYPNRLSGSSPLQQFCLGSYFAGLSFTLSEFRMQVQSKAYCSRPPVTLSGVYEYKLKGSYTIFNSRRLVSILCICWLQDWEIIKMSLAPPQLSAASSSATMPLGSTSRLWKAQTSSRLTTALPKYF